MNVENWRMCLAVHVSMYNYKSRGCLRSEDRMLYGGKSAYLCVIVSLPLIQVLVLLLGADKTLAMKCVHKRKVNCTIQTT